MKWLNSIGRKIKRKYRSWNRKQRNTRPEKKPEVVHPSKKPRGFYPEAIFFFDLPLLKSPYRFGGHPEILVIHHTAGNPARTGYDFMRKFLKRGLNTDFMELMGQIFQQRHQDKGGYHAGKSKYMGFILKFFKKTNVSRFAAGIEIANPGKLDVVGGKLYRWYDSDKERNPVSKSEARYVTKDMGYQNKGWFIPYTKEQEESLAKYIAWHMKQGVKDVVGHDDLTRRKSDVGGCLSLPMKEFIKQKVKPLL